MADIKYVGTSVNSAIQGLTTLSGKFQPVSTAVQTKTGVMIGCKGFSNIAAGDVSTNVFSGVINSCEANISALIGAVRKSQCDVLNYSGNQSDINDFVDSLSTSEYYALKDAGLLKGFDKKISGWKKAEFLVDNCFASVCAFTAGLVEGGLDFVENIGDGVVMLAGSAASGLCDLVGADEAANAINDATRAYVATDLVGNAFDAFYADTPAGQWIQNNSTVFDEARSFGEGMGYAGAVIIATTAANVLLPGVGTAVLMPTIAAASGFGAAAERSTADGATLGDALLYSTASAAWEGAQWAVGGQISKVGGQTLKGAMTRVALDAADSGLEGFVQPGLTMLYKDYGQGSFSANYAAAFNANGGFDTVLRQAAIGGLMSAGGEAVDMFRSRGAKGNADADGVKPDADGTTSDGGTTPDGETKAAGDTGADTKTGDTSSSGVDGDSGTGTTGTDGPSAGKRDSGAGAAPDTKSAADYLNDTSKTPKECAQDLIGAVERGEISPDDALKALNDKAAQIDGKGKADWHPDRYQHDIEVAGQKANAPDVTPTTAGDTPTTAGDAPTTAGDAPTQGTNPDVRTNEYDLTNNDGSTSHVRETLDGDGNVTSYTDTTTTPDGNTTTTTLDADGNYVNPDADVNARAAGDENGLSVIEPEVKADGGIPEADTGTGARPDGTPNETGLAVRDADANLRPDADANPKPEVDANPKPEADANPKPEADANPKPEADGWKQRVKDAGASVIDSVKHPLRTAGDALSNVPGSRVANVYQDNYADTEGHNPTDFYPQAETEPEFRLEDYMEDPIGPTEDPTGPTGTTGPTGPTGSTGPTSPTTPTVPEPTTPTTPADPYEPTTPTDPTVPTDPYNPTDQTDPYVPSDPTDPTDPSGPGSGHTGSGFGGDDEFNGAAFSLDDELDDGFDSIADIIANGSKFGTIPSSTSPFKAGGSGASAFVPIAAGLSAAAAVGLGTKAYLDKKNADEEDDEDEDVDLENWVIDEESEESADDFDDDYTFLPEELFED